MRISYLMLVKSESKRLTSKNTREIAGKPMFLWNLEKLLSLSKKVYVSSDSDEILEMAEGYGARGIKRPLELCGDTPNIPCYQHALKSMGKPEAIIAVQANSPGLDIEVIKSVAYLLTPEKDDIEVDEVMTCTGGMKLYGSVWGMTVKKLKEYGNPLKPNPKYRVIDNSVDIHTLRDFNEAEEWLLKPQS